VIRIGREEEGDRQTDSLRVRTSALQKGSQVATKGGTFSNCPYRGAPEPFDSDTPGLNVNPSLPLPSCRNLNPNWKIHPKTLLKQKLIYHFAPHKKDLHIYNLILPTKALFPSNVIVNLWYCKPPSLIQSGRSSIFFHCYVLLVYFIPIIATRNMKVLLKISPRSMCSYSSKTWSQFKGSVSGHFSTTGSSQVSSF